MTAGRPKLPTGGAAMQLAERTALPRAGENMAGE
jgi:hypothetical protein